MKKLTAVLLICMIIVSFGTAQTKKYTGYSWNGELTGTKLENATAKVEAILSIDEKGIIKDSEFNYWQKQGDSWVKRNDSTVKNFTVDFSKTPIATSIEKADGVSMFTYEHVSPMSLYGIAADKNGTVAFFFLDPVTRTQFEMKFPPKYNYNTPLSALTIKSGIVVPVKFNSGGSIQPKSWSEIEEKSIFDMNQYSYTIFKRSKMEGLTAKSTVKDLLTKLGVKFNGNTPRELKAEYGFIGNGGWDGNYKAISAWLKGKDANKIQSLVDWENGSSYATKKAYKDAINSDGFFGAVSGATRSAHNSWDGISGATVRMSRESEAYQRALISAGLLDESKLVKARF